MKTLENGLYVHKSRLESGGFLITELRAEDAYYLAIYIDKTPGCVFGDLVQVEAEKLENLKIMLWRRGCNLPLEKSEMLDKASDFLLLLERGLAE